jgi:hypothetical protein
MGVVLALLTGVTAPVAAQLFGVGISQVYLTAMPTWMYNGFTETEDGDAVQGSDVSPLRMTFGAGFELRLNSTMSIEPEGWLFIQEYIALKDYDKTVPTQIETGSAVGDIAQTIGLGVTVPFVYTWQPDWTDRWRFDGRAGLGLVYRIPVGGVDGTDPGPVGIYWIAGRFVYPQIGVAADYQFTDRIRVGLGLDWFIPLYNLWDSDEPTPFLDETMLRWGVRVRWDVGRNSN